MTSRARIAYVQLSLTSLAGVDSAFSGQALAASAHDIPIDFITLNLTRDVLESNVRFVRIPPRFGGEVRHAERKYFKYRLLARSAPFASYDVVVLRYVPAIDLDPLALFRRPSCRIVTVHHAKEAPELRSTPTLGNRLRAALEDLNSPRVLSRVSGIVGVTDEIRDYEVAKVRGGKPAATVSNGIAVARVPCTGFAAPTKDSVEVLFIASSHAPWHGTDRLLEGARLHRGPERVVLHMVGNVEKPARALDNPRVEVVWHGIRRGPDLDAIFRRCSVAVSSLAMHRNHLRQGAVLKTREYVARGMPFVYAYEDVDIPADADFALQLPANDDPIAMEQVIAHARLATEIPRLAARMRGFAEAHLDWSWKVRRLHDFVTSLG